VTVFVRLIAVGIAGVSLFGAALGARMEHNSFLRKPVHSTTELVRHVKSDAVVRARFKKHYKMTDAEVIQYLSSLRVVRLPQGKRYLAFNYDPKNGKINSRRLYFKAGTQIFVDKKGTPVLKRSCGNPLSFGPKGLQRKAFTSKRPQPFAPEVDASEFGIPPEEIMAASLPEEEVIEDPEMVIEGGPSAGGIAAAIGPQAIGFGFNPLPWLLGGAIFGEGFTHSRADDVVPEPSSLLVFAAAAGIYRGSRKRAKDKSRRE
jgi:hypothetical protein